jgi:hypothetical protein
MRATRGQQITRVYQAVWLRIGDGYHTSRAQRQASHIIVAIPAVKTPLKQKTLDGVSLRLHKQLTHISRTEKASVRNSH